MGERAGVDRMVVDQVLVQFVDRGEPQLTLRALAHAVTIALAALLLTALPAGAKAPDPLRDQQWHLDQVHAEDAWQGGVGDGVVVAVIDTGVDANHPDLAGQVLRGIDLVDEGTPPDDPHGHGTLVAGVVAALAYNGEGGVGASPGAKILPVRVLDARGDGNSELVARGVRWAADNGADVINLSLAEVPGLLTDVSGLMNSDFDDAVRYAAQRGALVVAAAGNDGDSSTPYPADLPLLVVGASDRGDQVWARSNRDSRTVFAPGIDIISTWKDRGYGRSDGTSFAAPIVAAAGAMLRGQGMTAEKARDQILQTAKPIGTGRGRVDLAAAAGVTARPSQPATPPAGAGEPSPSASPVAPTGPPAPATPPAAQPSPDQASSPVPEATALPSVEPIAAPPAVVPPDQGDDPSEGVLYRLEEPGQGSRTEALVGALVVGALAIFLIRRRPGPY
jgi:thermitase